MGIYIYCPRRSQGALELVHELGATRLRRFDGLDFWDRNRRKEVPEGSVVICWGAHIPDLDGIRVLNSSPEMMTKERELRLISTHVHCVQVFNNGDAEEYKRAYPNRLLARSNWHIGGDDLLNPPARGDYYTFRLDLKKEYRIHSFADKSIKAGEKVVRDGFTLVTDPAQWKANSQLAHPWVRSFDAGWRIRYDNFRASSKLRQTAHAAVRALGLTFGAVDIGEDSDGTLYVLEVNRAPGIEGNTIQAYVDAIREWIEPKVEPTKAPIIPQPESL